MTTQKTPLPSRLVRFFHTESAGGLVMVFAAFCALVAANSGASGAYSAFIALPLGISVGAVDFSWPLSLWVSEVLMVFFFLQIGMELKREMMEGVLSDKKSILLPFCAAVGGMAIPAALYLLINLHVPEHWNGWAIPSATDIAFALCVLTLLGKGAPPSLKIFLLAIAIFDDLGAILVIAFFYNHELALTPLLLSVLVTGVLLLLNRLRVASVFPYIGTGIALWFCLHAAGIHTTLAGVITGLFIPMRNPGNLHKSPLSKCMHFLHPWVNYFVLPLFAFTAAGVDLSGISMGSLLEPLPLSIAMGLFIGKQIGIFGTSWALIKCGAAQLPEGTNWRQLYGVSVIAGIGFTMSLFIGMLAFTDAALQEQVKIGVIAGSLLATLWGYIVLRGGAKSR